MHQILLLKKLAHRAAIPAEEFSRGKSVGEVADSLDFKSIIREEFLMDPSSVKPSEDISTADFFLAGIAAHRVNFYPKTLRPWR